MYMVGYISGIHPSLDIVELAADEEMKIFETLDEAKEYLYSLMPDEGAQIKSIIKNEYDFTYIIDYGFGDLEYHVGIYEINPLFETS